MIDFSQVDILKGIPQNTILSIFLAGFVTGFLVIVIFLIIFKTGKERSFRSSDSPHDIVMAIRNRAGARKPISIFGFIGFLLTFIILFVVLFAIVSIGRFMSEGMPNEEAFVPFVLRIFLFPLLDRYPFLQGLIK